MDAKKIVTAHLATKKTKKVIRKRKIVESEYDLCPHCSSEIGEKEIYCNDKGLFFHRSCGSPIEYEKSANERGLDLLSGEQSKALEQKLKDQKYPTGGTFYFRIRTFGGPDNKHDFGECHPECEYLEWTPAKYGFCNLFKKPLGKCRCSHGSGAIRSPECFFAVEGLI